MGMIRNLIPPLGVLALIVVVILVLTGHLHYEFGIGVR